MKTSRGRLFGWLFASASLLAQPTTESALPDVPPPPPAAAATGLLSEAQLEELLAPIALYPDALIALILPATTAPADIVLAARQVRSVGEDRSQIEHRSWDESVKSLTYYPTVLLWLDENLQWAKQVGEAFGAQPAAVMQAIQRLRVRARAAGSLVDTPEQQVLAEPEAIRIVPAQPDILYVPYYDWTYAYARPPFGHPGPLLSFGIGLPVGAWLAFDCDWRRHTIWVGNRHRPWQRHDWRHPVVPIPAVAHPYSSPREVRPWRPTVPPGRPHPSPSRHPGSFGSTHTAPVAPRTAVFLPQPARPAPGSAGEHGNHRGFPPPRPGPPHPSVVRSTSPALPSLPPAVPPAVYSSAPGARSDFHRGPDRPRPNPGVSDAPPSPRGSPTPATRTYTSPPPSASPAPSARPREMSPHRPDSTRSTQPPAARNAPPAGPPRSAPVTTVAAPTGAANATPPPAPAPQRKEGDSERSIGRRPPNEHQR